ncbi:FUSC family protein [Streptomyces sp. NPDC091292]|uniref:FUSC family protein n=1 Tax=Streptomyces sp. NPDC091292 TaxID=3365991 RepID=UPI0037F6382B
MSWLRALRETARSGVTVERKRLEPLAAARGAAGLAIVIAFSLWAFGPAAAASSAFGAFQAAIATFQRSWRPRPELAVVSGATLAVSTFLGYLTVSRPALFLALLALWTFVAGLSWAVGPTIGLIATSNVAIMLVTVTLPTSVAQAAGHGVMMIVGGLVQAALVVLFPIRRWGAHRDALADALAAEADYARRLRQDPVARFDPVPLMQARDAAAVTSWQARTRPAELHGARGLAERIRPVLAALADPAVGVPAEGPARDRVRELLAAAGAILDAAAHAIRHGTPATVPPPATATFRTPDTSTLLKGPALRAATRLGSLLDDVVEATETPVPRPRPRLRLRLRTRPRPRVQPRCGQAFRTAERVGTTPSAGHLDVQGGGSPTGKVKVRPGLLQLAPGAARAIRQEIRPGSPVLRHAIRVASVAAAGYLLGTALPFGHGYWAPMAAVMVMRPDFSQTYSRAVARFGGTLLGVGLATAIGQAFHPGTYLSATLAVLSAALMYLVMRTGQLAAQGCIAAYVVFLLAMGGEEWTQTVPERVLLTLIGGLLAMLSYAVYPAWETPRLRARLADWLAATGRYAATVVGHYAEPAGKNAPDVRTALLASRAARTAWHEAVDRARIEPVRHRGLAPAAAEAAAEAVGHIGRAVMLIEAHLPEPGDPPVPAAAAFADALRTATAKGAKAVRERRVPEWGAVRDALSAWERVGVRDQVVRQGAEMVVDALGQLSDALAAADGGQDVGRPAVGSPSGS